MHTAMDAVNRLRQMAIMMKTFILFIFARTKTKAMPADISLNGPRFKGPDLFICPWLGNVFS